MKGKKFSAHVCGGAVAAIVVWLINAFSGVTVPAEVAVAFGTVGAMAVGILMPDAMEADE